MDQTLLEYCAEILNIATEAQTPEDASAIYHHVVNSFNNNRLHTSEFIGALLTIVRYCGAIPFEYDTEELSELVLNEAEEEDEESDDGGCGAAGHQPDETIKPDSEKK